MNEWRVTKFNPRFRNRSGASMREEWTSVTDIGNIFNGQLLTAKQYRSMEDKYVYAALQFIRESQISSLTIIGLEKKSAILPQINKLGLSDITLSSLDPKEGDQISIQEIQRVCRLNLREILWCKLELTDKFFIHFGYDYYMYIGSIFDCTESIAYASKIGLFVEEFPSPYC